MTAAAPDKRAEALKVAGELLGFLDLAHELDLKDGDQGALSLAVMLKSEFAPAQKRSPFTDSFQLLLNKLVNRPGQERRYIAVGFGGHPAPRQPKQAAAPAHAQPETPRAAAPAAAPVPPKRPAPPPRVEDEASASVPADAALSAAVKKLAEHSAKLGRFYGLVAVDAEDRARMLQASAGIAGVKVAAVGEGRNRRVVFTPDKPVAMPSRALPGDDDDELD